MAVEGFADEVSRYHVYSEHAKLREGERVWDSVVCGGTFASTSTENGVGDEVCGGGLAKDIGDIKRRVENTLKSGAGGGDGSVGGDVVKRVASLEKENKEMRSELNDIRGLVQKLQDQINKLTLGGGGKPAETPKKEEKKDEEDDDEDIDLFGSDSDSEDEDKKAEREKRLAAYAAKKEKKPGPIAKSSVILDVKPWDDETDMKEIENNVRSVQMDGLLWGASKLVPIAYGLKKLQIMCVVEDEKVSIEELTEKIEEFEDFVQSVDIAAFNKI